MSECIESPASSLEIAIGGTVMRLIAGSGDHGIFGVVKKNLRDYQTHSKEVQCKLKIIPHSWDHSYSWPKSELDRFRKYFSQIHRRFPDDTQGSNRAETSLRLLQYLDPLKESIGHISAMIESQDMIYSRVGIDLFFYDTASNMAYLFIGQMRRRFSLFPGIRTSIRTEQDPEWTGILNGMMFVLSRLLIYANGLLLHGTALLKNGYGFLFLGLSGSGKSTITRLIMPDVCFSDDGVIVKKEKEHVHAYYSPFRQVDGNKNRDHFLKGEIKKVFFLEKAEQNRILPLRKSELMNMIIAHMIHFYKYLDGEAARKGFFVAKDILEALPSHRLQFRKNRDIWNHIQRCDG
jgi:hypothetical protein